MLNQDVLIEILFDCQMRKLSERTTKGYINNNLKMLHFISS
jgi:integrase/recombinase XerD